MQVNLRVNRLFERRLSALWLTIFFGALLMPKDPAQTGLLDESFLPEINPATIYVRLFLQPDGKLIVATPGFASGRNTIELFRLTNDGRRDTAFSPLSFAGNFFLTPSALDREGGIILAVTENSLIQRLRRINPDGSLDLKYRAGSGVLSLIQSIAVQHDGKAIVGGRFDNIDGIPRPHLARLQTDGTVDPSFHPDPTFDIRVSNIAIQADGKILAGGGAGQKYYARLNSDGTFDETFPEVRPDDAAWEPIFALQPDGKILLGASGNATKVGGVYRSIIRLNRDGTLDETYQTPWIINLQKLLTAPDGKTLVIGATEQELLYTDAIVRLNTDGSRDMTFEPIVVLAGPNAGYAFMSDVVLQPDGKAIVGGAFTSVDGIPKQALVRLNPTNSSPGLFIRNSISANESQPYLSLPIRRIGPTNSAVSVEFFTTEDTAKAGQNFVPQKGVLEIGPGIRTNELKIPLIDDQIAGNSFTRFSVNLNNPTNATILPGLSTTSVDLAENDYEIQFSKTRQVFKESDGTVNVFVTRNGAGDFQFDWASVDYKITDGTATPGVDYIAAQSGTIFFSGWGIHSGAEFLEEIQIKLLDDTKFEGTETIELTLTNPQSSFFDIGTAYLGPQSTLLIEIQDDDPQAKLEASYDSSAQVFHVGTSDVLPGSEVLEVSSDFKRWSPVLTNRSPTQLDFTLPAAADSSIHFFRLTLPR
jgi:uncharacterized delta-60 repeat protein